MRSLILASISQSRKTLLERFKIPFICIAPYVDETPLANEKPKDLVLRLAKAKATAVSQNHPDAVIIGADQVGVLDNTILGKPISFDNAVTQLQMMSGKTIRFFIGLCLLDSKTNSQQMALETFNVKFRDLSLDEIQNYLKKEDALNCAGSVMVEGLGIALLEELQGDDYTALIGLPLIRLNQMLRKAGVDVLK